MMLGVEHSRAVAEIQVQADFAKEAYARARSRASGRQNTTASQIAALEQERLEVEQAISGMGVGTASVEDDSVFVAKREQRSALLAEQNQLARDITVLEAQVGAIEYDLLEAERKKTAAQEQSEVEYLINSLVVVRCPHCESPVDAEARLALERESRTCHVCSQPIQRVRTQGDAKAIIRERDQEIATLRASLRHTQVEIAEKQQRLAASREESARLSKELEVNVRQARDGFSTSYATLLVRKGQIDGQLDQLRRSLSEMETEQAEVATAARWNVILQTAAEIADQSVFKTNEQRFADLGDLVVKLATHRAG
jgi:hypothetical protein